MIHGIDSLNGGYSMRIAQDFLNHLAPIELSFIQASITKLCNDRTIDNTTNCDNVCNKIQDCPYCGSYHYVKNGFNPHHKQKYRCQDCRKIFTACELNGLSLEQDSVATGLSVTTCFHMHHKLYQANIEKERMQASIAVTKED